MQGQVAAVPRHPAGAELWGRHPQPGPAPASASSSLAPFPLLPGQAARSSLWCAGNSPMAPPSPTISAALTPKRPSGRGPATPSPVPRREYLGHGAGGKARVEQGEIPWEWQPGVMLPGWSSSAGEWGWAFSSVPLIQESLRNCLSPSLAPLLEGKGSCGGTLWFQQSCPGG